MAFEFCRSVAALGAVFVFAGAAFAGSTTFTTDAMIGPDDASFDGQDIVVDGAMVTIDGVHTFDSLTVINGGVVTHTLGGTIPTGETDPVGMHLIITGDLTVEAMGSQIRANGRGFESTDGPGTGGAGVNAGGGAHGGAGGDGRDALENPDWEGGDCYGDFRMPVTFGSAGGERTSTGDAGGRGGGAIRLTVGGATTINGTVACNGIDSGTRAGGGAGGSIWIETDVLAGDGTISADGGSASAVYSGSGGGGRISISYNTDLFTSAGGVMTAIAGNAFNDGGAGTIYLADGSGGETLIIENGGYNNADLTEITGVTTINGDVRVLSGAAVGHLPGDMGVELHVAGDMLIDASSRVDVSDCGFANVSGPGAGSDNGIQAAGGSHGGAGGHPRDTLSGSFVGPCYGDFSSPVAHGSGGGDDMDGSSGRGGFGGGAIKIVVAGGLTIDGACLADGEPFADERAGGGAGGSIWIDAGSLAGAGEIRADGGNANTVYSGSGGGGRVAVYAATSTYTGTMSAAAGNAFSDGGAGTVLTDIGGVRTLVLDNDGRLNAAGTEVSGSVLLDADVMIRNGANLTHAHGDAGLFVTIAGDCIVGADGRIDAGGRGHVSASGPAAGGFENRGGGGGHGGAGGDGRDIVQFPPATGGDCYGDVISPTAFGSGGAEDTGFAASGGRGGGAVRLLVLGDLVNDGVISAEGDAFQNGRAGGGAGGSLWIECDVLSGAGVISADGGGGNTVYSGGGGGGRVSIKAASESFTAGRGDEFVYPISACGGAGFHRGGAGTIHLDIDDAARPLIRIANCRDIPTDEGAEFAGAQSFDADLLVTGGGVLTHKHGDVGGLEFEVTGDIVVDASGEIGGGARGFGPDMGPGAGQAGQNSSGGGHGGEGGDGRNAVTIGGGVYGDIANPVTLGSGGGSSDAATNDLGGTGGAAVRLIAGGTLTVDGAIRVDGGGFFNGRSGGGSGGSIWATCDEIAGVGVISALGGGGNTVYGGGGGGGRIALEFNTRSFTGSVTACGGAGFNEGDQGTVYADGDFFCPGDANCDSTVDFDDLNVLLENWGDVTSTGDVNGDGTVNFNDLNLLLESWGSACE